jgi:hypothetical protein
MTEWILILFAHVGPLGDGNSNALTTATFITEKKCIKAGEQAEKLTRGTVKTISFVCTEK